MVGWGIGISGIILLWVKILMDIAGPDFYPRALSGAGLVISLGYLLIGPLLGKCCVCWIGNLFRISSHRSSVG